HLVELDVTLEVPAPTTDDDALPALPPNTPDRVGVVRATVLELDRRPIVGAVVRALLVDAGRVYLAARAVSDGNGVAVLSSLPVGAHWIVADAPSHARASAQRFVGADPIDVEVRLGPERAFVVDVRDEHGAPIPASEIEVRSADPLPRG